jgi:NADPH:quinone reductase
MALTAYIEAHGGPEVIRWREVELAPPSFGQVHMRNLAIGLNFIDTYHRSGLYPVPLPNGLGLEAAGVIEAAGDGVTGFKVGDRVATFGPELGAYATHRNINAASLFKLPDAIDDQTAAAILLKGCTAEFLIRRCGRVESGWWVLVHAAAGGVGQILVPWLKHIGAKVIGVVSTPEKAELAINAGANHVLISGDDDLAAKVQDLTDGQGVAVTFDGVGASTWKTSLKATQRRGMIISFGNASGPVTGVNLGVLAQSGSLFVTRPTLGDYYTGVEERREGFAALMDMVLRGVIKPNIGQTYGLQDAALAQADLEARRTTGSTLLIP